MQDEFALRANGTADLQQTAGQQRREPAWWTSEMRMQRRQRGLKPRLEGISTGRLPGAVPAQERDDRAAAREPLAAGLSHQRTQPLPQSLERREHRWAAGMSRQRPTETGAHDHAPPRRTARQERITTAIEEIAAHLREVRLQRGNHAAAGNLILEAIELGQRAIEPRRWRAAWDVAQRVPQRLSQHEHDHFELRRWRLEDRLLLRRIEQGALDRQTIMRAPRRADD